MTTTAQDRLLSLLANPPTVADISHGYLDLLGEVDQAGPTTGLGQRLMRTPFVPVVYERWWRPAWGFVLKGMTGPGMKDELELASNLLGLEAGSLVLDVACGTGAFTRYFGARVGDTGLSIGLDASRPMLSRAISATGVDAPVAYLRADAVRPPLQEESLDGVCCFAALHMFDDPFAALDSFVRLLRPGGRVALLTSGARAFKPVHAVDAALGKASGMRMFDRGEIADQVQRRGLVDVSEQYNGLAALVAGRKP